MEDKAKDANSWIEQWHRGAIPAAPPRDRTAAAWQETLFDELVSRDPIQAFGRGHIQQILWQKRVDLALRYLRSGDRMLDVGCGNGFVARAVAERTEADVVGIDVSGECIRYAVANNSHPRVQYCHTALEAFQPREPFALATMYEVLEHVDRPEEVMHQIVSWLAPGGVIIISTPNRSSLNRRIKNLPVLRDVYRRRVRIDPSAPQSGHVEEYTFDQLTSMLDAAGLELADTLGAVLLMPFPDAIRRLAANRRFVELNVRSGDWIPRLASDVYLIARVPDRP